MAKAGFYLYGSRGKVGNLVARKGPVSGTVLAERKFSIKNPRTNKQMSQRIICATVAQAAKFLSPIIDHSFESKSIGARSKDYFRKLNMNRLRSLAEIDYSESASAVDSKAFVTTKGVQALIPNSYIISRGSMPASALTVKIELETGEYVTRVHNLADKTIQCPETTGVRHVTLGQVLGALFGITQAGEQLTFVGIQKTGASYAYAYDGQPDVPGWEIPYTGLTARRLFVPLDTDLSTQIAITDAQGVGLDGAMDIILNAAKAAFASMRTDTELLDAVFDDISDTGEMTYDNNALTIDPWNFNVSAFNNVLAGYNTDKIGYIYAYGIIRSRLQEDNTWTYSNSALVIAAPTSDETTNFGLDWNSGVQAWMSGGGDVATDDLYLQAGTPQNVIGEDFT